MRVKVALTCGTDLKVWKRGYHARMITPPAVFGHEFSGVIEQLGEDVADTLHVGDRVVPSNSAPCGICLFCRKGRSNLCEDLLFNNGAYAEYIRIPGRIVRQNLLEIPAHVSFLDAAMVEPLACVLRGIEEADVHAGDTAGSDRLRADWAQVHSHAGRAGRARDRARQARRTKCEPPNAWARERPSTSASFPIPIAEVRRLTEGGRGADSVIEAVGSPRHVGVGSADGALRRHGESLWRLPARHASAV